MLQPGVNGRCAVPATGFYEWFKPVGSRARDADPFLVQRAKLPASDSVNSPVMFMAGVYDECFASEEGDHAFVIVTTAACREFSWLHDRQPCFLDSQGEVDEWLDSGSYLSQDVVSRLLNSRGELSWRRMLRDLSKESTNQTKPKAQSDITTFFPSKSAQPTNQPESKNERSGSSIAPAYTKLGVAEAGRLRGRKKASHKRTIKSNERKTM